MSTQQLYRMALLPGIGRIKVPAHLSDAEVLEQIHHPDEEATPTKKT